MLFMSHSSGQKPHPVSRVSCRGRSKQARRPGSHLSSIAPPDADNICPLTIQAGKKAGAFSWFHRAPPRLKHLSLTIEAGTKAAGSSWFHHTPRPDKHANRLIRAQRGTTFAGEGATTRPRSITLRKSSEFLGEGDKSRLPSYCGFPLLSGCAK